MRLLQSPSSDNFQSFVSATRAAVIHFDAEWDIAPKAALRGKMQEAEAALSEVVNFGEIDCDRNPDLARAIPVLNVPLVAYYLDGKLVAALIGARQNVLARLRRVLRGEPIHYKDGTDEPF